jgi:ADP-ribosylglycohydrolase
MSIFRYDALLGSGDCWVELCKRAMLHGGDNDSTGVMAGAWFGAMYGFRGVSENNYKVFSMITCQSYICFNARSSNLLVVLKSNYC